MTLVQQTSLDCFVSLVSSGRLVGAQRVVFRALAEHNTPLSNRRLAELLSWSINRVTPRVLELRQQGLVFEAYVAPDPLRRASFWVARKGVEL